MSNTEVMTQQEECNLDNLNGCNPDEIPEYRLYISKDRVKILLDSPDPHCDTGELIHQMLGDFKTLEIPEYPDAEILTKILKSSCQPGGFLFEQTIIMGQASVSAINGRLEWARDFFADGWEIDEKTGAIDFWAKCESRSVIEGELLVSLHHPVDGVPGLNVFGNEIPVSKPGKVKLRSGKNVTMTESDGLVIYTASCAGRVRFADGVVAVDDVYIIKGNVNLETGNIVHTGAVMIQGDVGAGATLQVEGDIIVKGMLEPCNIKCGGSLTVAGGIVGEEGYNLEVHGDLIARYISEASIVVGGDVLVGNEISYSEVLSLGKVRVPKGRIAGGRTFAHLGIRISEAGASGSSVTHLAAGIDHTLADKIFGHNEKIRHLEDAQEKIEAALVRGRRNRKPTDDERKFLESLEQKMRVVVQTIGKKQQIIHKLKAEAAHSAVEEILITKELWSGTTIQLGREKVLVRNSMLKPRIAQKRKRKVVIGPLGEGNMPEE